MSELHLLTVLAEEGPDEDPPSDVCVDVSAGSDDGEHLQPEENHFEVIAAVESCTGTSRNSPNVNVESNPAQSRINSDADSRSSRHSPSMVASSFAEDQESEQGLTPSELLLIAVCNNDVENVDRYLKEGANPNMDFREGAPALLRVLPKDHFLSKLAHHNYKLSWTPLHHAASYAFESCTRLLLAAGADPDVCDDELRTVLDVVGSSVYFGMTEDMKRSFTEVIRLIREEDGQHNSMRLGGLRDVTTPLHTAVELENGDAFRELFQIGVSMACLNEGGETPLHVCVRKKYMEPFKIIANAYRNNTYRLSKVIDVQDRGGYTVLHSAIRAGWRLGACLTLELGADVVQMAIDGETPLHTAAATGNIDILKQILRVRRDVTEYKNGDGATALFKAMWNGHCHCVEEILKIAKDIDTTSMDGYNVLHVAAMSSDKEILKLLLETYNLVESDMNGRSMLYCLTTQDGFGPLHYAVSQNNVHNVKELMNFAWKTKNVYSMLTLKTGNPQVSPVIFQGSTPLHIAAVYNHAKIAEFLINCDRTIIDETNSVNEFPLHTAINHRSRDVIKVLLCKGENLLKLCFSDGPKKDMKTAIDMIVHNLPNPTKFLEDVFNCFISTNNENLLDPDCKVIIDFRILMPEGSNTEQMSVIEALLETGNRYGQEKLLVHPLVESFLHLKWRALLPFFYTIVALDALYVMSLTIFSLSFFFYKDTKESKPAWLNSIAWGCVVNVSITLIILQEILLYINGKRRRYFYQLETWVKVGSLSLASVLVAAVLVSEADWPRHVATGALLLAWIQMMILLSRFPNWGYYALMFGKVATNVVTILLTFTFLLIGFSFSFMIQFRSQAPFDGPVSAFVKTMVMMTSEFEYTSLFDKQHSEQLAFSFQLARLIFIVFLVLAAIVLMNLMVGVAVHDIRNLELLGNIRRLDKQVEFLSTLDTLVYNKVFAKILSNSVNSKIRARRNVSRRVLLWPGLPMSRQNMILPGNIQDAIFNVAQAQKKLMADEEGIQDIRQILNEIRDAVVDIKKCNDFLQAAKQSAHDDGVYELIDPAGMWNKEDPYQYVPIQLNATN